MTQVTELPAVDVESLEKRLLVLPQLDIPLQHRFAPGVYLREVVMPAGAFVIGHEHKTEHFNIITTGRASVLMDGEVHQIVAPAIFISRAGVRKLLYIHEGCTWATVHSTGETDLARLEEQLIVKSGAFLDYQAFTQLQEHLKKELP